MTSHCGRVAEVHSRREFLARSGFGFGGLALGYLLGKEARADSTDPLAPRAPHFPAQAKRVIFIFLTGGLSHVDSFDPKPELTRLDGRPLPPSFKVDDLALQFMKPTEGMLMASPFAFKKHGRSGVEISDLFPHLARHADDLAVIRSCHHESFIHGPAITLLHTGSPLLGHPSAGAWVSPPLTTSFGKRRRPRGSASSNADPLQP
jgi:hypothetical protein